jgi:predicted site-specific integrase-resolvase
MKQGESAFVNPSVAGQLVGVSRFTILRYLKAGAVQGIRLPSGHWRVSLASVLRLRGGGYG